MIDSVILQIVFNGTCVCFGAVDFGIDLNNIGRKHGKCS